MKLQTSIPPRRDGTVTVQGLDGKAYVFASNAEGDLVGEIEHEPTVAHLLAGGSFMPADEADFDAALATMQTAAPPAPAAAPAARTTTKKR